MLLKKKNIIYGFICSFLVCLIFVSCSKDDGTVDPVDDTGGGDDMPPVGFVGEIDWIKNLGGSEIDDAVAIVKSNDNGYVVLGNTSSIDGDIIDKTTTDSDFWVLKISETGTILWNKTYGGSNNDTATDISTTADGGYIISGGTRSSDGDVTTGNAGFVDYWILKIDATGGKIWDRTFGFSGEDRANKVFQTKDGGYLVSGFFDVTASGGAGNDGRRHAGGEFWTIKLNAAGNYMWRRYYGGFKDDRSYDAVETSDGGYFIIGTTESVDGDVTDNKGSYDFWIVKINANGDRLWSKSYGGSEIDTGYAITATEDGNFMFVGDSRSSDQDITNPKGNADLWVVKFGPSGNIIWQKSLGGSQFDSARSIEALSDGNYLISGATRSNDGDVSTNNGENDAWVLLMNPSGDVIFEKAIGGSNFDFGEDAILGHDNASILLVGNTESNDKDIPGNRGIKDMLVVKLK
ncbi:MAG: hypothetical protein AAFP76_07775 [Bacteroidota bacterium]